MGAPLSPGAGKGLPPTNRCGEENGLDSEASGSSSDEGDTAVRESEPPAASPPRALSWEVVGGRVRRKDPRFKNSSPE